MFPQPTASLHLHAGREFREAQRRVLYLLQGLARRGHRVLFCGPRTAALFRKAEAAGIPCEALTLRSSHDFPSVVRLARLVRDQHFDLVHAHDAQSHHVARAARDLSGARALTANLFLGHRDLTEPAATLLRSPYAAPGLHHIAVSKPVRDGLLQRGAAAARIAIVPDGVDLQGLRRAGRNGSDPWGLRARGRRVIGTCTQPGREKSLAPLFEAFALLHRRLPDTHLLVAGDGPGRLQVEKLARDLGLAETITFAGPLEEPAVMYALLHAFVALTDYDNTHTCMLEAMGAGTPVVAAAVPGVLGLVRHGNSALVVPPRDVQALAQALGLLLLQPDLSQRLVQGASSIVEQHSVERMVEATLGAYHGLGQIDAAGRDAPPP